MALFGLWSLCVFFELIEIKEKAKEDKPPPKQKPVLPPTVSKMEWDVNGIQTTITGVIDINDNIIILD